MRSYLILSMCVLFILQYFIDLDWLKYTAVVFVFLSFITSAPKAKGFPRIISIIMMSLGLLLEFTNGNGFKGTTEGILLILPLISLVTLAPLISLPLKTGGYFEAVDSMLRNLMHYPKKLFAGITVSLFILSPILSLGSVRIIDDFLKELKLPSFMSAKSYLLGFSTAILWSPYFASVSLVLYYLDLPVGKYILYGIGLSILSLLLGNLLFAIWEKRHPINIDSIPEIPLEKRQKMLIIQLALFVTILMSSSLLIEYISGWSMIVIVCIISIILPIVWSAASRGWKKVYPHWKVYKDQTVPMLNNEIMLFSSGGLLAHASQGTTFADTLSDFLTVLAQESFLLFAVTVLAIILLVTYIGIHQIAIIAALAMQLNAEMLGITNLSLAMLLLISWYISSTLSPFSGVNLLVSRISGINGVQAGLRANGLHLTVFSFIGIFIFMLMNL